MEMEEWEGESILSSGKNLPYKVWGANVRRRERVGLE